MIPDARVPLDSDWQQRYAEYVRTPTTALAELRPGSRVFVGTGCAAPQLLIDALANRALELTDTEIVHLITVGDAPYAEERLAAHFRVNSFFVAENVRHAIQKGLGDYTPIFLSDIPRLFDSGRLPLDVALIQVSPPDERGLCTLGVSVDIVKSAAANATLVIAEVNPRMPRTCGDSGISIFDIDLLVPADVAVLEVPPPEVDEATQCIGGYVAALVEDGSTMELGIGRIPQAVLQFLAEKKDLGIHTEMLTDAIVDLVEQGVITGSKKSLDRGRIVASFALGTRRLYDFLDNNELFHFAPTEYVNDPFRIAQQHKMVAINVALQVDLTGQVCADSLGSTFYSGIGGQVDFNRGAARCPDGKAIIAMPSTADDGRVSRISCHLSQGAGVVTTRGDVHYVVTEYGVAYLHGKPVAERALALITIAHPDFRAALLEQAIAAHYVSPELQSYGDRLAVGPPELRTTVLLDDGTQVKLRPIHPTDEPRMRDLFHALSRETLRYRFLTAMKKVPRRQIQNFTYIDHRNEFAIVATLPAASGDEIIATGRYYLDKSTNRAEVAFVVRDEWQGRGIGTSLYQHLGRVAVRNGIAGFTAEVLPDNKRMLAVFQGSGHSVTSRLRERAFHLEISF